MTIGSPRRRRQEGRRQPRTAARGGSAPSRDKGGSGPRQREDRMAARAMAGLAKGRGKTR